MEKSRLLRLLIVVAMAASTETSRPLPRIATSDFVSAAIDGGVGEGDDQDAAKQKTEGSLQQPTCHQATVQCNYRAGCGSAMVAYLIECHDLVTNRTDECAEKCKNTLVGLASTDEGGKLLDCDCGGDVDCETTRARLEACRESVLYATRNDTVVTCAEAQWICMADAECAKALEYYHLKCRGAFLGRRCDAGCRHTIGILRRQKKAAKLEDCWCDEGERDSENFYGGEFSCKTMKENTARLCYDQDARTTVPPYDGTNALDDGEREEDSRSGGYRATLNMAVIMLSLAVMYKMT